MFSFSISVMICTPFSTHTAGHFTVLTPLGAPRGEILLQNVFWPGTYVAIIGRVFITVRSFGIKINLRYNLGFIVILVLPKICLLLILL